MSAPESLTEAETRIGREVTSALLRLAARAELAKSGQAKAESMLQDFSASLTRLEFSVRMDASGFVVAGLEHRGEAWRVVLALDEKSPPGAMLGALNAQRGH